MSGMTGTNERIDLDALREAIKGREPDIIASLLPHGIKRGVEWWTLNPTRDDEHLGSFSVCLEGERAGCWHDFATGQSGDLFHLVMGMSGSSFIDSARHIARMVGLRTEAPTLDFKVQDAAKLAEWKKRQAAGTSFGTGCRLQDLAEAKSLPIDWLRGLGLREHNGWPERGDHPAMPCHVEIPYLDRNSRKVGLRRRSDIRAKVGSTWKTGSQLVPYGLHRLTGAETSIIIAEGESDCWCLWHAGIAAIGLPGAGTWKDEWAAMMPEGVALYLVREPDEAGGKLAAAIAASPIAPRVKVLSLPTKDPADLWVQTADIDMYRKSIAAACSSAKPLVEAEYFQVRTHDERAAARTNPPPFLIDGCLPMSGVGAIVALPGVGKTLVAVELARCIASGEPFAGRKVQRGRVLYICPDAPASTERRLLAMPADSGRRILSIVDLPKRLPTDLPALRKLILAENEKCPGDPIVLMIFDTWDSIRAHASGGYADQDSSTEAVMAELRRTAEALSIAIVIVHHSTRQDTGRARGSLVFDARCDSIANVEATGKSVVLTITKNRDGECGQLGSWDIKAVPVGPTPVPTLVAQDAARAKEVASEFRDLAVLRAIVAIHDAGNVPTVRAIADACGLSRGRPTTRPIERLRDAGLIAHDCLEPTDTGMRAADQDNTTYDLHPPGCKTGGGAEGGASDAPGCTDSGAKAISGCHDNLHPGAATGANAPSAPPAPFYRKGGGGAADASQRRSRLAAKPSEAEDLFALGDQEPPKPGRRKGSL